jgi:hypothetical protein
MMVMAQRHCLRRGGVGGGGVGSNAKWSRVDNKQNKEVTHDKECKQETRVW